MRISIIGSVAFIATVSSSDVSSNAGEWVTCEAFNLKSIPVVGAPNPFCLVDEPCGPNSVAVCPGAGSYDLHGVLLTFGSCCALLDGAGSVGCVSRQLVGTSFQCIGSTFPPINTPLPPRSESSSGSRADPVIPGPDKPSPTPIFPTTGPVVTTRPPTVKPSKPTPTATDSSSSSSSPGSSSSSSDGEPDAGDEPITLPPSPTPSPPLTFEPIIEEPTPAPTKDFSSPVGSQDNSNNNSGETNTAAGSFYASLDSNMALILVLGSVATIAIIIGAVVLRRGSGNSDGRSTKHSESTLPPLTPPFADDFFDGRKTLETFSPIRVQAANPYAESSTPGRDRQSYFL